MRHGIVLFTCDRGITPAQAAKAAEERGFDATGLLWGLPDAPAEKVEAYLDRLASRISS